MDHIAPWPTNENGNDMVLDAPKDERGDGSDEEGANAMSTDSSEEEEDDPEEARKIREGFIVDEDEEEEEEEEEEEQSDDDKRAEKRRRRKKRHRRRDRDNDEDDDDEMGGLDEDDLDLVEQYTGQRVERPSKSRLKRLRRAGDEDDDEDDMTHERSSQPEGRTASGRELGDLWDDDGALRVHHRDGDDQEEPDDDDDLRGFIAADDDDEENGMGEAEKEELHAMRRAAKERRKNAGDISRLAGLDQNALTTLFEVFGDGTDYDMFLGDDADEVQEVGKENKYNDVFEPSEIRSRMLTEDDDLIRNLDMPERMLLATSSLSPDTTLSLDPQLSPSDLDDAAYWVSLRLGQRIERDFFREDGQFRKYLQALITAVRATLDFLFIQSFEVPFIWTHKRDFIWHVDGAARIELLSASELWRVYNLGQKFRAFQERKRILEATHAKLSTPDDYYKIDIQPRIDSMEAISDATEWLSLQHRLELQDASMIEDDGKTKRPTRVSTFEMLKRSPIDRLVKDFCPPAREISRKVRQVMNSRGQVIHMFLDDPALPPLEHVAPYVDAEKQRLMEIERKRWASNPTAQDEPSPSKEVNAQEMLDRARLLIAMELGKDPLLRQVIRDLFKASAHMTCLPTEKGLVKIDETHSYFNFKYLDKKPVSSMTRGAQFLHIMAAEAEHLITVDISLSEDARSQFLNDLIQAVSSDGYGTVSKLWNEVRIQAVTEAVDKTFLPFGAKWIREWLREEVEDWLARRCGDELERRVNVKPLFTKYSDPGLGAPSVIAVSWGDGDPKKDAIS
ncbi:Transcription elongation factor spt6, partial [Serendipita sp. 399]